MSVAETRWPLSHRIENTNIWLIALTPKYTPSARKMTMQTRFKNSPFMYYKRV